MISPSVETRMRATLAELEAEAERLERTLAGTSDYLSDAWRIIMGTSSVQAAARETARQARKAVEEMRPRFVALVSDPAATDDQGETFILNAQARGGVGASIAASQGTTAGATAEAVAKQTAQDVKNLVERGAEAAKQALGDWAAPVGIALFLAVLLGLYVYGKAQAAS